MLDKSAGHMVVETCDRCPDGEMKTEAEAKAFWSSMNPQMKRALSDTSSVQRMAIAKYVCVDDLAQVGRQGMLRHLLFRNVSVELFKSEIVRCVAKWKWRTFWRNRFLLRVLFHGILVVNFSVLAACPKYNKIWTRESVEESKGISPEFNAMFIAYFTCLAFIIVECMQLFSRMQECWPRGLWYYFRSPWNMIKLLSYAIMVIFFTPGPSGLFVKTDQAETAVAFECMLLWITVLYYAQPFRVTGPLVATIRVILWDILPFLMLGLMVMMGFSIACHTLFHIQTVKNVWGTFETMFYALFGTFEPSDFREGIYGHVKVGRAFVLDVFLLFEGIILISLLVAIMGDSYDKVRLTEKAEFIRCRSAIIDDCEASLTDPAIKRLKQRTGRYLHVLIPVDSSSVDEFPEWHGRLNSLQRTMCDLLRQSEQRILSERHETERKIEEATEQINHAMTQVDELKTELKECKEEREIERTIQAKEMLELKIQLQQMDEKLAKNNSDAASRIQTEVHLVHQTAELRSQMGRMEDAMSQILHKLDQVQTPVQQSPASTSEAVEESDS